MSKSRSGGGSKGSRSNSTEAEDPCQQQHKSMINPQQLTPDTAEANSLVVRNESTVPSSPPPSYEHVLEETRMEQSADKEEEEEETDESEKKKQEDTPKKDKSALGDSGGGGGPGGGERPAKGPEILHKSSKEFYRAVAKQWGITCKMSDHCRCLDCQSHYFDCEYEKDEQEKTDGGLGAGTPMFISEVIHGTACVLL